MKKSLRLIELQRLLKDRARSTGDLAVAFGCSPRVIQRDLADLRHMPGLAVSQDAAGRWRVEGEVDTTALRDGRQWQETTA